MGRPRDRMLIRIKDYEAIAKSSLNLFDKCLRRLSQAPDQLTINDAQLHIEDFLGAVRRGRVLVSKFEKAGTKDPRGVVKRYVRIFNRIEKQFEKLYDKWMLHDKGKYNSLTDVLRSVRKELSRRASVRTFIASGMSLDKLKGVKTNLAEFRDGDTVEFRQNGGGWGEGEVKGGLHQAIVYKLVSVDLNTSNRRKKPGDRFRFTYKGKQYYAPVVLKTNRALYLDPAISYLRNKVAKISVYALEDSGEEYTIVGSGAKETGVRVVSTNDYYVIHDSNSNRSVKIDSSEVEAPAGRAEHKKEVIEKCLGIKNIDEFFAFLKEKGVKAMSKLGHDDWMQVRQALSSAFAALENYTGYRSKLERKEMWVSPDEKEEALKKTEADLNKMAEKAIPFALIGTKLDTLLAIYMYGAKSRDASWKLGAFSSYEPSQLKPLKR